MSGKKEELHMKKNRQEKILELIARYPIGTQDELIEHLEREGCHATQATVSRDIRALKLVKLQGEDGGYRYVLPSKGQGTATTEAHRANYQRTYGDSILSVAYAMNNVVIKTTPGMASAVALVLDHSNHDMMLGSVAGDDTIIVVTRSTEDSRTLVDSIEHQRS